MVRAREWTGFEAAALQEAMRRSIREFAAHLGVETADRSCHRCSAANQHAPEHRAVRDTRSVRTGSGAQEAAPVAR